LQNISLYKAQLLIASSEPAACSPRVYWTQTSSLTHQASLIRFTCVYSINLHHVLPPSTCHLHNAPSSHKPKNPAIHIPPESATVTAPKLYSRSVPVRSSLILAKVLTYTAPPNSPSQNITRKTIYTFGINGYRAWSVNRARLRHCSREGGYKAWMRINK